MVTEGCSSTFIAFLSLLNKSLGGQKRFVVFAADLTFLIANDKLLIKT